MGLAAAGFVATADFTPGCDGVAGFGAVVAVFGAAAAEVAGFGAVAVPVLAGFVDVGPAAVFVAVEAVEVVFPLVVAGVAGFASAAAAVAGFVAVVVAGLGEVCPGDAGFGAGLACGFDTPAFTGWPDDLAAGWAGFPGEDTAAAAASGLRLDVTAGFGTAFACVAGGGDFEGVAEVTGFAGPADVDVATGFGGLAGFADAAPDAGTFGVAGEAVSGFEPVAAVPVCFGTVWAGAAVVGFGSCFGDWALVAGFAGVTPVVGAGFAAVDDKTAATVVAGALTFEGSAGLVPGESFAGTAASCFGEAFAGSGDFVGGEATFVVAAAVTGCFVAGTG